MRRREEEKERRREGGGDKAKDGCEGRYFWWWMCRNKRQQQRKSTDFLTKNKIWCSTPGTHTLCPCHACHAYFHGALIQTDLARYPRADKDKGGAVQRRMALSTRTLHVAPFSMIPRPLSDP